jgi:hypothetical protein
MSEDRVGDLEVWQATLKSELGAHALMPMLVGTTDDNIPYDRGFYIRSPYSPSPEYRQTSRIFPLEFEPYYLQIAYPNKKNNWGIKRRDVIGAREQYDPTKPIREYMYLAIRQPMQQILRDQRALEILRFDNHKSPTFPGTSDSDFTFEWRPLDKAPPYEAIEEIRFKTRSTTDWSVLTSFLEGYSQNKEIVFKFKENFCGK